MTDAAAPLKRGPLTIAIMLATIMQVLDTTIANVALPSMQGSLGAAQDSITWVLTSYIVASAIMTPMTGWLTDRIGLKQLFLISVVGFTLASMLCGTAGSLEEMVAWRLTQGVFGAALVPLSQTVLLNINPEERHGQAMAMWGAGVMVGPVIGPTLGGWLTESLNWRWVFYINVPIGIIAFLGILAWLPAAPKRPRGFDFIGFALLSIGVGALQLMLDRGEQLDWFASPEIWVELGVSISAFWAFGVHMLTAQRPFVPPHLLRDRNLVLGLVFIFIVGIVVLAAMALLPPMLQRLMGYPTITTGMVMAPRGIGVMVSMLMVGRLMRVVDPRLLILVGLCVTGWSLHMMTGFTIIMDSTPIIVSGVIQGLGIGMVFVPLSAMAFATLAPEDRAEAAGLFSLVRNMGNSLGVSIVISALAHFTQVNHAELAAHVSPFNPNIDGPLAMAGQAAPELLAAADLMVNRQAAMIAYLNDFQMMMVITLAAIPLLLLLRKPKNAMAPDAHAAME
ncbi:DHA2 family efflux MFS transporter permease subunit [Niveispirillum sp. KHB5.9]|uniref:DHA2 family efflux MFS transporter permease subunit n=1 Tax=Niveispirillum sp. KHB5.9 TaxID=3400269 RepID=UPI003A894A2F